MEKTHELEGKTIKLSGQEYRVSSITSDRGEETITLKRKIMNPADVDTIFGLGFRTLEDVIFSEEDNLKMKNVLENSIDKSVNMLSLNEYGVLKEHSVIIKGPSFIDPTLIYYTNASGVQSKITLKKLILGMNLYELRKTKIEDIPEEKSQEIPERETIFNDNPSLDVLDLTELFKMIKDTTQPEDIRYTMNKVEELLDKGIPKEFGSMFKNMKGGKSERF